MLSIRLSRFGKKKQPTYRLIVLDKRKDTRADYIESLGFYNPKSKEKQFKKERILYWIKQGAQPSVTVYNLLINAGILEGRKIKKFAAKKKTVKEEKKEIKEIQEESKSETDLKQSENIKTAQDETKEIQKDLTSES